MSGDVNPADVSAVRERTQELLSAACDHNQPVLIEAPPNSGKTDSALRLAATQEKPVTYLAARTDLYEQASSWAEGQAGIKQTIIPSPHRDCPTFSGDNDGNETGAKRLYNSGYSAPKIHYSDEVETPCGKNCPYLTQHKQLEANPDAFDLIIGNHAHARATKYIKDRLVVFDEFNKSAFLSSFPEAPASEINPRESTNHPGNLIPTFLQKLATSDEGEDFPSDVLGDVTDIVQHRNTVYQDRAIDWFHEHNASRGAASEFSFLSPTSYAYNTEHLLAPLLTFSLCLMRRVGPGFALAPHPDETPFKQWTQADLAPQTRCLRNRNTGVMHLLRPPDLSTATQVIGLDGLPTVPLWNLLLATGTDFDHWQVIDRDERTSYIKSGLNMDLVQIGSGIHPYSGGRTSPKDPARLRYVTETEGEFALVSSKEAIQDYEDSLDLRPCLRPDDGSVPDTAVLSGYKALHYSLLKSSNAFKKEPVGVIMGSPSPNDRVIQRWAGFCGQPAKPEGRGEQKSFGEFGDRIYEHFVHDRIAQALFRFGRDESVWANGGATVYISTTATHDWLPVDHTVQFIKDGEATVVKTLRAARYETDDKVDSYHTVSTLDEELDLSQTHLRSTVEKLTEKGHVDKRPDAGPGGADLYRWVGTEPDRRYTAGELSCLTVGHDIYLFDS